MLHDDRIRKTLLASGLADSDELRELEIVSMQRGTSLYRAAVLNGRIDEAELVAHLAAALGVASVSLRNFAAKQNLVDVLPAALVRKHRSLPVGLKPQDDEIALFVAMDDPHDLDALEAVGQACRLPVVPLLAGPIDLDEAIERVYPRVERERDSGNAATVPPVGDSGPDAFANVLQDLERAQSSEMLSALSLLDDIPRNRHEHITPSTGMAPVGPATDLSEPPPAPARRQASTLGFGSTTAFSKPAPDTERPKTKPGFQRAGPPVANTWRSRDSDELVRALVDILLRRGLISEAELRAALGED